jgi:rubrerythrin
MTDYIEREAAIGEIEEWYEMYPDSDAAREALSLAKRAIRKLPAADVRPVVRAHWTDRRTIEHDGEWYCSNCGNEVTICMCGKDKIWEYPFCPNCGADMREES